MGILLSIEDCEKLEVVRFEIGDLVRFVNRDQVYIVGHIAYFSTDEVYAFIRDPIKGEYYRVECVKMVRITPDELVFGYGLSQ